MLAILPQRSANASCNLIPQAQRSFRGTLGATDRPFATPGNFVELSVRPMVCDTLSPGFGIDPDDYVVTLVFEPPNNGPRRVVVLTTDSCGSPATDAKLDACGLEPSVASVTCMQVSSSTAPIGLTVVQRQGENRLAFRFPDTDALFTPDGDDRTLSGPVSIAVSNVADATLPCGLATTSCAAQAGLVACVDDLYTADGTCAPNVDAIYGRFTALPQPNAYQFDCFESDPPCNPLATELRATLDAAGNLLLPFNWQGIILRPEGNPVPRLLRATIKSPLPFSIPSEAFVDSYTPEGGKLPPIFEPQFDPTVVAEDVVTLFGSADAPATVLRIARHRGICDGGSNDGQPCAVSTDCGGGTCDDACGGGSNDGLACTGPGDCPGGLCGSLYGASVFQILTASGGPLTLERVASGINGICQKPPHEDCSNTVPCPGGSNPCVRFSFQAQDPVPLEGLMGSDDLFSFVLNEAVDLSFRNGDGDSEDFVVTLRSRTTGNSQALGAPSGCGLSGTPEGRAVLPVFQDPFQYPAVAAENDIVAFMENEAMQNNCDQNGNSSRTDPILRVFRLDEGELTDGITPPRVVDPAPLFGDRALAVSNGFVFYRRPEARQAERILERVSVSSAEAEANGASMYPSISADGTFVAFQSAATNLGADANATADIFVRDRESGDTEWVSDAGGLPGSGPSERPSISDDGRYVAFQSFASNLVGGDTNGAFDVFVRDRQTDTTQRVSVTTGGGESFPGMFGGAGSPIISGNGRYVAFDSSDDNLVAGDSDGQVDVFIHDRDTVTTTMVTHPGEGITTTPVGISTDGRYVAYRSGPGVGTIADRQTGTWTPATVDENGIIVGTLRSMSADGRFVTFEGNLGHLYVRDVVNGTTVAVDYVTGGTLTPGCGGGVSTISGDGRVIPFLSCAAGVVSGFPGGPDVGAFLHDRLSGVTEQLNAPLSGGFNDGSAAAVAISFDGRSVAFEDASTNLVAGDTNSAADIFVASIDVDDPAADIFPDGNLVDTVLEVFDTNNSTPITLCPALDVAVNNGKAAFLRPESTAGTASCPSGPLNSDGDTDDLVVQLWPGTGDALNLGRAATAVTMSDTLIAALVSEPGQGPPSLNSADSDTDDTIVQTYPVAGGAWHNVGQAADVVKICGSVVAFLTPEAAQGSGPLNFDMDTTDRVLQIFNPSNGAVINTGYAAEEFACSSNLISFRTSEIAQAVINLNSGAGDTDTDDYVLHVYDIGRPECIAPGAPVNCVANSRNAMRTCRLAACDPRIPYRVGADETTFIAYECDDGGAVTNGCAGGGTDHSGDIPPFAGDLVIRSYNVRTNTTRTLGRITGGNVGPNGSATGTGGPLDGGQSPDSDGDTGNGIVYETVGRCVETIGGVCSDNGDCEPGDYCDESTCKREQRVCVNDTDCTGGVTCETSTNAGIVPASPDTDSDGVPDHLDNCIYLANAAQTDVDLDRVGDLCDLEVCGNGILNAGEQCDGSAGACPGTCLTNCTCAATPTSTPTRTPTFGLPPLPGTPTITPTRTPTRTPTSSPTAPLTCGNNILEGVEQCDGTADGACPGGCLSNCVCAVCGDEVVNGAEQCDGDNDGACPGGCDEECLCTGSVCGDNFVDEDEDCDGTDDLACPGQCDNECACPDPDEFFDSVVAPRSALKVAIAAGASEVTKKMKVKVINGDWPEDFPGPHNIQLIATDGTCPAGTVLGVDFDGRTAGYQPSISVNPFKAKAGTVYVRFEGSAITTHNSKSPYRCAVSLRVIAAGVLNEDPQPSNDRISVDINVFDENDAEQSFGATTHETVLLSQKAANLVLPLDLEDYKTKAVTTKVLNADILPSAETSGHAIDLTVDDNDCPPGTATLLTPLPVSPLGSKSAAIKLLVRAHPDDFEAYSKKSPARCTVKLTATTTVPGNTEPSSSNNVTDLVINVYDKNDL
jgi:Tol biopolymer transport system component